MSSKNKKESISPELPGPVQVIESFERFFDKVVQGSYPLFVATLVAIV
jgi:hypothetical protein